MTASLAFREVGIASVGQRLARRRYGNIVHSADPFIKSIPSHWTTRRFKFILQKPLQYGANEAGDDDDPNQARFIRITDIAADGSLRDDTFRSLPDEVAKPYLLNDGDDPPRAARREIRPLTGEQVKALLKAAKGDVYKQVAADRLAAIYTLAVTSGLRLGELFALQWSDLELDAVVGSLVVRHTLMELNGKLTLSEPKTAKSRRKVELSRMAVDALWDHRKKMLAAGWGTDGFVFRDSRGGPLRRSHFHAVSFKPLLKRANLPAIRFHDLRHTAATLLLAGGEHPKVVQELLGHANISMTMDIYSHTLPTMQREAVDRLGEMLSTG